MKTAYHYALTIYLAAILAIVSAITCPLFAVPELTNTEATNIDTAPERTAWKTALELNNVANILNKYDGTVAPTANDDSGDGYSVGSVWFDTVGGDQYYCLDATLAAAVWERIQPDSELGTIAGQDASSVAITGGSFSGLTSGSITGDLTVDTSTLKVDSANNWVGIGTASPQNPLHILSERADASPTAGVHIFGSNNPSLTGYCGIEFHQNIGTEIDFGNGSGSNDYLGRIAYVNSTNRMAFSTNSSERLSISSAGVVQVAASGSLAFASNSGTWDGATMAGAQTFTGQLEATGQAATTDDSLMTRSLGDRRYINPLKSINFDLSATFSTTTTTGGSTTGGSQFRRVECANGSSSGACAAYISGVREVIGESNATNFAIIDFSSQVNANISLRSRVGNPSSDFNWIWIFGSTETASAAISNMVKTGTSAGIGWVGLECIAGSVKIIAVDGTSAVQRSDEIDNWGTGGYSQGYRLEIVGGTANCYNASGSLLGTLASGCPTAEKQMSVNPYILVEAQGGATTSQLGLIIQHLSFDW